MKQQIRIHLLTLQLETGLNRVEQALERGDDHAAQHFAAEASHCSQQLSAAAESVAGKVGAQ